MLDPSCTEAEKLDNPRRQMQQATKKPAAPKSGTINAVQKEDLPIHGWYRFVLSYPPHLVRQYMTAFGLTKSDLLLDPFCGTGTTLVEARKHGLPSVGGDAHPFAALVSRVKTNWALDPKLLKHHLSRILRRAEIRTLKHGLASLSFDSRIFQEGAEVQRNAYALTDHQKNL